jgi:hypothetical protein
MKENKNKHLLFAALCLFVSQIIIAQETNFIKGKIPSAAEYYRQAVIANGERTTYIEAPAKVVLRANSEEIIDKNDIRNESQETYNNFEYPFRSGEIILEDNTRINTSIVDSGEEEDLPMLTGKKNRVIPDPPIYR